MNDFVVEIARRGTRHVDVFAPHPDDEIFAAACTMRRLQAEGIGLRIIAVTDGEASHAQSTLVTPQQMARRRLKEVEDAYRCLEITPERLRLKLPDGGVSSDAIQTGLSQMLKRDTAILAPLIDDGHPDHEACGEAAQSIGRAQDCCVFFYQIWTPFRGHASSSAAMHSWSVECDPNALARKAQAIDCFQSQLVTLGPAVEDGPVLPADFVTHFLVDRETFFGS